MKNILLLGATGSIGKSVLSVLSENSKKFNLFGISFNKNFSRADEIINKFSPKYAYIEDTDCFNRQCDKNSCQFLNGDKSLDELIRHQDIDCLLYTSPSPRDSFRSRMPSSA